MWPDRAGVCCLPDYLQEEHGIVVANLNSALVQTSPQTWGFLQAHGGLPAPDVTKVARSSSERMCLPVNRCTQMEQKAAEAGRLQETDFDELSLVMSQSLQVCLPAD